MYPDDTFLRHLFFAKKKEYKRFVKKQKRQFHSALLDKVDALADKNPKEHWKLVNSIKANQTKKCPIKYRPQNGSNISKI